MPGEIAPRAKGLKNATSVSIPVTAPLGGTGVVNPANSSIALGAGLVADFGSTSGPYIFINGSGGLNVEIGGGTATLVNTSIIGGSNTLNLRGDNAGVLASFPAGTYTVAGTSVSLGGTGVASNTAYAVLCGGTTTTGAIQSVASLGSSGYVLTSNGAGALPTFQPATGGGGSGTVTSVTYTGDGVLQSSTPSTAITTSGTLTAALKTQTANKLLAGPTSGSAATPTFRSMVSADLPSTMNTLATYSNGTFTPIPANLTVVGTPTYLGYYVRTGALVFVTMLINSTTSTSCTYAVTSFSGLPYPCIGGVSFSCNTINNATGAFLGNGLVNSTPNVFPASWSTLSAVVITLFYFTTSN